jgi:hypothetical protein
MKCYDTREETSVVSKKLVPRSGTFLCSMKWNACGTWTLRGMFPLWVKGFNLQRIYGRNYLVNAKNCWGNKIIMSKQELKLG